MRQKGFTLIELLFTMALSSIILTGTVVGIHQVMWGTDRSNSQVVALTDLSQAAVTIKKDLMVTQFTDLTDGNPVPQSSVNLSWVDYTAFESDNQSRHSSSYILSGTELQRTHDGTVSIVARNITSIGFTKDGRVVSVVITATGPGASQRSETLEFSAYFRAEELE